MFKIAIIGRPNVGKSTLFNKLVGKNIAIANNISGVTRDRKESKAKLGPIEFIAIDTAGLENQISDESLEKRMLDQTEIAVIDADLCLFVIDYSSGITKNDIHFVNWIRKIGKKTILLANKCENLKGENFDPEYYKLGFGLPIAISAEHNLGFGDLYDAIAPHIEEYDKIFDEIDDEKNDENPRIEIAVVGRPNAGKSTFINSTIKQNRLITGKEAGITRDSIAIDYSFKNYKIKIIDTAGIRKKANINQNLEKLSIIDSFRAIRFAQVVILMIDATSILDHQDVALAGEIIREGRAIIFAINKIDLVTRDKESFLKEVRKQIEKIFPEVDGSAIIGVVATNGYNIEKTFEYAIKTYEQWGQYIQTSKLNEWLKIAEQNHPPKLFKGKRVKLKYATQIKKRPPTIAVFTNHINSIKGDYQRYLVNSFRDFFNLKLTPVRVVIRKSENPFSEKKEKNFSKKLHKK